MTKCNHFEQCMSFFKEQAKCFPATLHFLEEKYCNANNHHCARYAVFMAHGDTAIPLDLFPCQQVRGQVLSK